ncbi:hypothetical protein VUR80DRAFT_5631 [Thermomyces stellatus]
MHAALIVECSIVLFSRCRLWRYFLYLAGSDTLRRGLRRRRRPSSVYTVVPPSPDSKNHTCERRGYTSTPTRPLERRFLAISVNSFSLARPLSALIVPRMDSPMPLPTLHCITRTHTNYVHSIPPRCSSAGSRYPPVLYRLRPAADFALTFASRFGS